jgi:Big-like domain-containing protein
MKKRLAYAGALLAILVGALLTMQRASAQILPPLPGGSLIVTITSPSSGATVSGTIPVNASVSIIGTLTVSRVEFFRDGNFIGSDSGAPYSVSWNTTTVGNGSHTLVAVGVDILGVRWNSNPVTVTVSNGPPPDTTPPSVTINQAAGQADPTTASPINFTVVFSEAVSGFTGADVTISGTAGGTKTATVSGGPSTYNVAVSGMTSSGTVIASIAAGVAQDAAGNPNTASTSTDNTVSFDATAPSVTINQAAGQADPTTASPINFTVVFDHLASQWRHRIRHDHRGRLRFRQRRRRQRAVLPRRRRPRRGGHDQPLFGFLEHVEHGQRPAYADRDRPRRGREHDNLGRRDRDRLQRGRTPLGPF